jgi:hypothetical protein
LVRRPLMGLLYQVWNTRWNENWQEKPKYSEKTCPSATLSTINATWYTWDQARAAGVGSRRLTAWATAWRDNQLLLSLASLSTNLVSKFLITFHHKETKGNAMYRRVSIALSTHVGYT